jgi:Ca2+-binding EF-hand superfamily protein
MAQFAEGIFQRYDSNKSGVFEKDEWKNFRTDPTPYDTNKDGKITRDELIKGMTQRFGGGRSSGGDSGQQNGRTSWSGGSKGPAGGGTGESPNSYRFKTAHDLLPEGIPQWFREGDRNKDGQIAMSEYSGQWNEKTLSEYYVYDRNRDGLLTVQEVMSAKETGFVRGVTPPPKTSSGDSPRVTNQAQETGSKSSEKGSESSAESNGPDERYVKYAVMTIGRYDENKDGVLSLEEIKDAKNVKAEYDQNKDGKLTPAEIATGWSKK